MVLETIIQLYLAFLVVVTLHELGHFPKKIEFKLFPIPSAVAVQGLYRPGGLLVNIALFISIAIYKPENIFIQYIGLLSWLHYIFYAIAGSLIPEPKESSVNISTYVFDDVDNGLAPLFIASAFLVFFLFREYYLPIFMGLF